jgi:hypothetical protein
MNEASIRRGRRQVLVLFGIAFATVALSYLTFYFAQGGAGLGTTNHGDFVDPPMSAESLQWPAASQAFATDGKWWLWVVTPRCDATCTKTMHELRALHILLNKESPRVARGLLTDDGEAGLLTGAETEKVLLLRRPAGIDPAVYIVDPIGNLVLRYPVDTPPKPVLEDLRRLLKLSQIG